MKFVIIIFLGALFAAPVFGAGALIFALVVLSVLCFTGAGVLGKLERGWAIQAANAPDPMLDEPVFSPDVEDYLRALEHRENRWVPAGVGMEKPFPFEGRKYLKVVNHHLSEFGYLDIDTGEIFVNAGSTEKIAQVRVRIRR